MTVYKNVNIKKSDLNKQYRVVVLKELQELMSMQKFIFYVNKMLKHFIWT